VAKLRAIVQTLRIVRPKAQLVAAVAVRERAAGGVEFLLVRTSSGQRWTLPKGHRDPGETLADAAAREAAEEAGVAGTVEPQPFAHYRYPAAGGGWNDVAAFRLHVECEGLPAEAGRDPQWFGLEMARSRLAAGRERGYGEEMERLLMAAQARSAP